MTGNPKMNRRTAALGWLLALACLAGCGRGDSTGEAATGAAGGPQSRRRAPAGPPVPIAVEPARLGQIAATYQATATLGPQKEAEVVARVAGVVEAIQVEEGDWVDAGQTLLRIDNDEYRLRVQQATARTQSLASRFKRLEGMLEKALVAAEEFETVRSDLKLAEADEGLARLNLSYTRVKAPFRGRVTERLVDVGSHVASGTPLFRLADFDPLLARVFVPAKEFNALEPDQPVTLRLDSAGTRLSGKITLVSPIIDPQSGTIKLTIEIPEYPDDVRPGDFAQVQIVTETHTGATLVPRIAVVSDRGERVCYVVADSTAERRVVEVGFEDDDHAELLSGVAEGEPVVVKGQRSLKHGALVRILEGDEVAAQRPAAPDTGERRGKPGQRRPGT